MLIIKKSYQWTKTKVIKYYWVIIFFFLSLVLAYYINKLQSQRREIALLDLQIKNNKVMREMIIKRMIAGNNLQMLQQEKKIIEERIANSNTVLNTIITARNTSILQRDNVSQILENISSYIDRK